MKFLGRKGQGAMEYLMTYGWAILVVMIVGIVMWQLGIFNPSGTQSITMQGFTAVKPQLAGSGLSAAGIFTGTFLNAGGAPITILSVSAHLDGEATESKAFGTTSGEAGANEHVAVTVPLTNGITALDAGESYALLVRVEYEVIIGSATVTKASSGLIRGPAE